MASQAYQLGLLLVVFGGFLTTNSSGEFAGLGVFAMYFGLSIGVLSIIQEGIPNRKKTTNSSESTETQSRR